MNNAILAFDLGLSTGWAYAEGAALRVGTIKEADRDVSYGGRFSRFRATVGALLDEVNPQMVCYEDAAHAARRTSTAQAALWFGWQAHLTAACHERQIPYFDVTTNTFKAAFKLAGNCGKNPILTRCQSLGIDVANDNEADAVAVLSWALGEYGCSLEQFRQGAA